MSHPFYMQSNKFDKMIIDWVYQLSLVGNKNYMAVRSKFEGKSNPLKENLSFRQRIELDAIRILIEEKY